MKILGSTLTILGFLSYFGGLIVSILQTKTLDFSINTITITMGIGVILIIVGVLVLCFFTDYFKNGFTVLLEEEDLFHEKDSE